MRSGFLLMMLIACGGSQKQSEGPLRPEPESASQTSKPDPQSDPEGASVPEPSPQDTSDPEPSPEGPPDPESAPDPEPETKPDEDLSCPAITFATKKTRGCQRGKDYPECKWRMPFDMSEKPVYTKWRNTTKEHWWGREALVQVIIDSAHAFRKLHPEQLVRVGDLDAPGPRHRTHRKGVDVDLYLPGQLLREARSKGRYRDNYKGKSAEIQAEQRKRVFDYLRALSLCSKGRLRVYYNDPVILERFAAWHAEHYPEMDDFPNVIEKHNKLHDFHLHVTFAFSPKVKEGGSDEAQKD